MRANREDRAPDGGHGVSFREGLRVWCKVAALSFGGPAGQIAVMHRILVEEKRWISENRFLHALNYCMLLPGPEAQQLAVYVGWLMHGTWGGIAAGTLFVLPGFLSILALSIVYAGYGNVAIVSALFFGLKPAVLAVVVEAVFRIGRRALRNRVLMGVAAAAFIAIFFFDVPFPAIILAAAAVGLLGGRLWPQKFHVVRMGASTERQTGDEALIADDAAARVRPSLGHAARVLAVCLPLWFAPLLCLALFLGTRHVFVLEGRFFSKAAVVTFGGAYAVLAYVAQQAVHYGWLRPREMLDGLGMAETTPGPLIQVVQFVGFMGAFRDHGTLSPMLAGTIGAVLTTWVTFVPCFLWIFLGAPYIEHLRGSRSLSSALSGITASVVGVVLNLAVWFAFHALFSEVGERRAGPLRLLVPEWRTLDIASLVIAVGAFLAIFRLKVGMIKTLGLSVVAGSLYFLLLRG